MYLKKVQQPKPFVIMDGKAWPCIITNIGNTTTATMQHKYGTLLFHAFSATYGRQVLKTPSS